MSSHSLRCHAIVLAVVAGLAWQSTTLAQYTGLMTEHDWTASTGEYRFGLHQSVHYPDGWRRTEMHWGAGAIGIEGGFARTIAVIAIGTLATALALVSFALAWTRGQRPSDSAA